MESTQKSYKVILEQKAEKQLKSLSKIDYRKVQTAIEKIAKNPLIIMQ